MTRLALVLPALLVVTAGAAAQDPLDRLLARFDELGGLECRFREERRTALLRVPLVNEGRIHFDPPGRFLRVVERPEAARLLIAGGRLQLTQADQVQTFDIADNATLQAFLDSFRAVLAGDRAALERFYDVTFEAGSGDAWALALVPREANLRRFLRRVELRGDGTVIERMVVEETSGDVSTTTFSAVNAERRYSDAERARLFRIAP